MPPEILLENLLLQKIKEAQQANGLFLSRRSHPYLPISRNDDNVFFTSSIVFVLQLCRQKLGTKARQLLDAITEAAEAAYPNYQNKHGLNTYNFYRTNLSQHFPNGWFMRHLSHFELPDDADCTALIYLSCNALRAKTLWLQNKLAQHANLAKLQLKTSLPEVRNLPAYSTWFGQEMPIEFDACVLSNILFLFCWYDIPLNQHDQATLEFLRVVISSGAYFKNPYQISPSYPSAAIVLYHIIRLVSNTQIHPLVDLSEKLKADVELAWKQASCFMERVLLDTCRMRLGGENKLQITTADLSRRETQVFAWFTAAFFSPFANPVMQYLAKSPLFQMKYSCPAMNFALLLEHEVCRRGQQAFLPYLQG